jgi:hypothetical protein
MTNVCIVQLAGLMAICLAGAGGLRAQASAASPCAPERSGGGRKQRRPNCRETDDCTRPRRPRRRHELAARDPAPGASWLHRRRGPECARDRVINPDLERFYAKRMGAKTTEIKSIHVPFISHPKEVARLIDRAPRAAVK